MGKNLPVFKDRQLVPHGIPRGLAAVVCAAAFLLTIPAQAQQTLQVLHKHVRPEVISGRAAPVGFLPSTERLNLVIHLPVRNQDELTGLIDRLSDPTSPDYRHWLSVAEFTDRFGRTEAEYQKVADFAEANGFAVNYKSPNRLMLVVRGSVAQIDKTFHVQMRTYRHPVENRIFYSPDREPSFALDVPVSHISGLNDYSYPHPGAGPRPAELGGGRDHSGAPGATGSGPGGTFLGSDMRAAYNMGSNTGTGQTVGLAEFSGYTASDVSLYFSNIGQTNNVPIDNIVVDGGSATTWSNANDEGEVCLDIEQAVSVAPGLTQLRVYIGPTSFGTGVDGYIFSQMATDNVAKQLSNSWWWFPDDPATDDPYFEEMATQGQTFFSISGDYGAYTGINSDDMGYPAEDVHLTVVGGTTLTTAGAGGVWQSEVVWNDYGKGSGGGPADDGTSYFAIQSWQTPVINSSNGGSTTLRNSPDVALQADFDNYICYDSGACAENWGGTSFAAPRWAAWLALVNQQLVANGQPAGLGFINPTLYSIGQSSSYNSDFHDITSGNNDTNGQSKFYYAVTGYDLTTGWGSMNGQPLMAALAGRLSTDIVLITSPNPSVVGQQVTLGVSVWNPQSLGRPTGTVTFYDGSTSLATVPLNSSGNAGYQTSSLSAGSHSLTASYSGDNNYLPSTSAAVIQQVNAPAVTLSPTSLSFGNQAINMTSAVKKVTLTNTGGVGATLTISSITASTYFAISAHTCPGSLAAGAKCTASVTFTPTVLGPLTGLLTFSDNAANSPQTVALSGTGVEPAILTPATAIYASQAVGTTSAAKTFTLTNMQNIALTGVAISTYAPYAVSATTCTTSLAAKAKCKISVTFTPEAAESYEAALFVYDSASNSPQTSILLGTGVVPTTLTPASATYAAQAVGTTSAAKTFTLTNKQNVALTGIAISTYAPYAVSATTCTTSLAAKGKCTISVTFTPEAAESYEAALFVYDSASNSPQTSILLGTGK